MLVGLVAIYGLGVLALVQVLKGQHRNLVEVGS